MYLKWISPRRVASNLIIHFKIQRTYCTESLCLQRDFMFEYYSIFIISWIYYRGAGLGMWPQCRLLQVELSALGICTVHSMGGGHLSYQLPEWFVLVCWWFLCDLFLLLYQHSQKMWDKLFGRSESSMTWSSVWGRIRSCFSGFYLQVLCNSP